LLPTSRIHSAVDSFLAIVLKNACLFRILGERTTRSVHSEMKLSSAAGKSMITVYIFTGVENVIENRN
jgi:hypothetical protein